MSAPCQQRWLVDDLLVASGENCDTDVNQSELGCGAKTICTYSASKSIDFTHLGSNQVEIYTHYAQFDCVDQ